MPLFVFQYGKRVFAFLCQKIEEPGAGVQSIRDDDIKRTTVVQHNPGQESHGGRDLIFSLLLGFRIKKQASARKQENRQHMAMVILLHLPMCRGESSLQTTVTAAPFAGVRFVSIQDQNLESRQLQYRYLVPASARYDLGDNPANLIGGN